VGQYLKTYARGAVDPIIVTNGTVVTTNDFIISTNGNYVVDNINSDITDVTKAYPLRLIVHHGEDEPSRLLQRVFYGVDPYSNSVITRVEAVLDSERLDDARRISTTHLPWSPANEGWLFDGSLEPGGTIEAVVTTEFDDHLSNPFLHTYHPDHDNIDALFANEAVQGSESYTMERSIRLAVDAPGTNFMDRARGGQTLFGEYQETLKLIGMARAGGTNDTRQFEVRGVFKLDRISTIPVLTDPL
jgi:hypothetical protein